MEGETLACLLTSPAVLVSLVIGGLALLLKYIVNQLNAEPKSVDKPKNEILRDPAERKKELAAPGKSKKKGSDGRWAARSDKAAFSHPWVLTTLKGHSSQVLDMDFSSNGKYLASCADEDLDPGGDVDLDGSNSTASSTSGNFSDSNRESSSPSSSSSPGPCTKGLSRRQRKNRRREDLSPPESKKKTKAKSSEPVLRRKSAHVAPLRQYEKLNLSEKYLAVYLRSFVLSPEQMLALSYPLESKEFPGQAVIFKGGLTALGEGQNQHRQRISGSRFDVNAQEFVPGSDCDKDWNVNHDSGQGSGNSSDSGEILDDCSSSSGTENVAPYKISYAEKAGGKSKSSGRTRYNFSKTTKKDTMSTGNATNEGFYTLTEKRICARCSKSFYITSDNEYLLREECTYHWGKLLSAKGKCNRYGEIASEYTCCGGRPDSRGCEKSKLHVWNGIQPGFNGPFDNYVHTRYRKTPPPDGNYGIYAIDCEMCYTIAGLELGKVTVIGVDGRLVYETFVRPEHEIIDFNTRFSGITAKDLNRKSAVKSLREVQNDLMGFISANTILIGHGLENDLRALRIIHPTCIDTAAAFPHYHGFPFRRSLKSLTSCYLHQEIQTDANGHNSFEDARACMELILWKVRREFKAILGYYRPQ